MSSGSKFADETRRSVTGIAVVGEVGASYTIYEKNWTCRQCKYEKNYGNHLKCTRCKAKKPQDIGTDNIVSESVLQQPTHAWRETIDPSTQQLYYFNTVTGAVTWDRPAEMGAAPMASGWFGRGAALSEAHKGPTAAEYAANNERYLKRPARKQKDHIVADRTVLEGANEFNIWYGKYLGEHWRQGKGRVQADSRCVVEEDAGCTKADKVDKTSKFFCIHFARGMCARGPECQYFHRVPTLQDDAVAGQLHDCFGRERHANHRDDMDGVGSFNNPSRTLYVGGILKSTYRNQEEVEAALWKHFGEWGEVEHINFVPRLSIAFVRFRLRTNCEFAKEAMQNQALDGEECLNLKWAYDDPNPKAQDAIKRANMDAAHILMQAQGIVTAPAPFDYPDDYQIQMPDPKRARVEGATDGASTLAAAAVAAYPDTDAQYHEQAGAATEPGAGEATAEDGSGGGGAGAGEDGGDGGK